MDNKNTQTVINYTDQKEIPKIFQELDLIKNFEGIENTIKVIYVLRESIKDKIGKIIELGKDEGGFVRFEKTDIGEGQNIDTYIKHPFIDKKINIQYLSEVGDLILKKAKSLTEDAKKQLVKNDLPEEIHVTSAIIADMTGGIIGAKSNADYHIENGCGRHTMGCSTGEGYERCEGCQPQNHGEQKALDQAIAEGNIEKLKGSTLYFYGHYWITKHCTDALLKAGISDIIIAKEFVKKYLNIKEF